MNRLISMEELIDFANQLSALSPKTTFHIINMKNVHLEVGYSINFTLRTPRFTIREYNFKDEHPNGADPMKNSSFWHGNVPIWTEILLKEFGSISIFEKDKLELVALAKNLYNYSSLSTPLKNEGRYLLEIGDVEVLLVM